MADETKLDDASLRELGAELGRALRGGGRTLATAESCTGGWIAKVMTDTAGSSDYFAGGVVCYADAVKQGVLGMSGETLAAHGAVSEATVAAMARGALDACGADVAVAVSGIAGPDGAVEGKPVGTVCFGWARRESGAIREQTATRRFAGDREAVRRASVAFALEQTLTLASRRSHDR